jgi:uncharacterized protein
LVISVEVALIILLILGIFTGVLSNVTSGGAGILTIYFLTTFLALTVQTSTGTVLAASAVITLIGTISFYKKKQIDWKLGTTVGVSGIVGAYIGGLLANSVQNATFEHYFGIFCLALGGYTIFQFVTEYERKKKEKVTVYATIPESSVAFRGASGGSIAASRSASSFGGAPVARGRLAGTDPLSLSVQIAKGILIGLATGLFGVALASMSIVLFILLFKLDTKMILGTSLFASVMRYAGGAASYITTGSFSLDYFLLLAAGGSVGSIIGARMILGGGTMSKDIWVKLVVIAILLFIGYSFLTKP